MAVAAAAFEVAMVAAATIESTALEVAAARAKRQERSK
jgi:hypothetical protein